MKREAILLVGEICVDFTLATKATPVKMRLGGVVHAARGLWACDVPYAVAAVCPSYLISEAEIYLRAHGCLDFVLIGTVVGAPNVILIGDVRETGHQGYEDILRDAKRVEAENHLEPIGKYKEIVLYPGSYDIGAVARYFSKDAAITIDVAYDVKSLDDLDAIKGKVSNLIISTSSKLFLDSGSEDILNFLEICRPLSERLLLKENRGGSRLFWLSEEYVEEIPAVLDETVNSVGVGDVYTAVYASYAPSGPSDAAWRGMQVATRYAQTTFPDDFKRDVQRDLRLAIQSVRSLGGIFLPWHDRPRFEIYLAAPDFTYLETPEIDEAVAALHYHNFVVRRPVIENGEAEPGSSPTALLRFYSNDLLLLDRCSLVFAIPLARDPGTLIEMGMAIAQKKPVITFDPRVENENTMVICGSKLYSRDLDYCLNAIFECVSALRKTAG